MFNDAKIKKVVDKLWFYYKRYIALASIILVLSILGILYVVTIAADDEWIILLALISLAAFTEIIRSLSTCNHFKSFLKTPFPIAWTYENGSVFTMNRMGFIFYNANPSEVISDTWFDGVSWDVDNVKGIYEDLVNGQIPIGGLLPKLKFKSLKNHIPVYNPFVWEDKLSMRFVDLKVLKLIIINLEVPSSKASFTLQLPIPEKILFGEIEWKKFVGLDMIGMNCTGDFEYSALDT